MKKKHVYIVEVSRSDTPAIRIHVLAESKAQARAAVANTMIHVARAEPADLLDVKREDVLDATTAPAGPDQGQLPMPTAAEELEAPKQDAFLAGIEARDEVDRADPAPAAEEG